MSCGDNGLAGHSDPAGRSGIKIGKLSENAMKRSVLGQIRTKREEVLSGAGIGKDCAIFSCTGRARVGEEKAVAVSVQEAVLRMECRAVKAVPGEATSDVSSKETTAAIEEERALAAGQSRQNAQLPEQELGMTLAELIVKCVNNLAAGGAQAVAVMPVLFLPETIEEHQLRALMAQAQEKCAELSIELAGGQTRVTAAVSVPLATVTAYGIGAEDHSVKVAAPGQDVILSKWIGLQGTAQIAECCREKLLERYPAWLVEEAASFDRYLSVLPEAQIAIEFGVCAMHDASEGGILGALWELAEGAGTGLCVDLQKIPLRQETVEVCECCRVNPYELLSGGCLLMTAWDGHGLVTALEAAQIPAVVIGKLTDGNDRILTNGEEIRYLDRPQRDGIYQITRKEREMK